MPAQAQSVATVTQASVVTMDTRKFLLWTIITRGKAEQVLQAFCWGKEANLPWLLHEDDGLRGAHVATSSSSVLRLLQVCGSSPFCTPTGDIDRGATQLLCTDSRTYSNIRLGSGQCLDQLPSTGTSAGSQALDRVGNNIESLLDLLPVPADQHADARSWDEALQQVRERATPGSILKAAEAWLRLIWLDATYKHLQPVHAILAKHGRRLSDLQPLVAAIHASHRVQCPAQDQQQQKQQNLHLLQELLPGCQPQELHRLLALIGSAVVNLHPHPQHLKQQLITIVTKKLQLSQVQVTGLNFAADPAPVPAITAADSTAVAVEETAIAGVTASVHQAAADRKGQAISAVPAGMLKRSGPADATGSVSKKQREGAPGQATQALQNLQSSPKPEAKQALGVDPLAKQPVLVAEAPAEQPAGAVGSSQDQQVAGPASQHRIAKVQHPADSSSPASASTAAVAAPPSDPRAGVSKLFPVKLPPLRSPGGARRAPVSRYISIRLAVNGVNTAAAPAASAGAGARVSADLDKLEADGVSTIAAEAAASADVTPGKSQPPKQLAELAAKQEQQQPVSVTQQQQQQQQSQPPAAADPGAGGGMFSKAPVEVYVPQQQKQRGEHSNGQLPGAVEQSAAGGSAAGAATGTAGGPSAAHSADAADGPSASSGLSAGRHTAPATHKGGVAAAAKQQVKQETNLGLGSVAAAPPAPVEASKPVSGAAAAGNGDTKSAAAKEFVDGMPIDCTSATPAMKVSCPAVSGAAEGRSRKPPAAVARELANTAVAAPANHALAAYKVHAAHAAQQHSATSSTPTAMAADKTNLVILASGCATAVAPSSRTAISAERSAAKIPAARADGGRLTPAKRNSIPTPWSATPVNHSASTSAVAQEPQAKDSGAASGAGGADIIPPAKRARIPIPKPLIAGHSEPAASPTASASATRKKPDASTCSDSLAPAPAGSVLIADPRANPVFLQLLKAYKGRLREYIRQEATVNGCWGVELGKAGNPQLEIMMPELFEYKKQLGSHGMVDFVKDFLGDEFEVVYSDPRYMLVLRRNSRHQQPSMGPADDTGTAADGAKIAHSSAESDILTGGVFERLSYSWDTSTREEARSRSVSPAPETQEVAAVSHCAAAASKALLQQRRVDNKQQQSHTPRAVASLSLPERLRGRLGPLPGSEDNSGDHGAADGDGVADKLWQPATSADYVVSDLHERPRVQRGTEAAADVALATSAAAGGGNSSKGKSASQQQPVQQHTQAPEQPPKLASQQLRQREAANGRASQSPAAAAPAAGVPDHSVQIFDEFTEVWYYKDEGQVIGPKSIRMLRRLAHNLPAEVRVEMDNMECFTKQQPPECKLLKHLLRLGEPAAPDV